MEKTEEFLMKPKVDYAFKEIMMNDEARRGFIAAVLGIDPAEQRKKEALEKGIAAMVTVLKELSLDGKAISKRLIKKFKLSLEEAEAKTEQYWNL